MGAFFHHFGSKEERFAVDGHMKKSWEACLGDRETPAATGRG